MDSTPTSASSTSTYQPAIDGLRTLAVISVLLFHLGFDGVSGGYVGVDVFFVISGFLITRLIVTEIDRTGRFDFRRFNVRRIRRLFPAQFVTIGVTWACAFLLFSPAWMADFSASAALATLSTSNFYFWFQADYFDTDAITKPLLHTWSLSVEEQFYLVWPLLLTLIALSWGQRRLVAVLAVICVLSLTTAERWLHTDPAAAYYLLPSRAAELGIGALMVWAVRIRPQRGLAAEIAAAMGLVMVLTSCVIFDETTAFPGIAALLPCLGTALFIAGTGSRVVAGPFRTRPAVLIGKISYSVYLVHWPLIVFYHAYWFTEPGLLAKCLLFVASLLLGWLQYAHVEQRFRHATACCAGSRRVFLVAAAGSALLVAPSLYAYVNEGLKQRVSEARVTPANDELRRTERRRYCGNMDPALDANLVTCQNHRDRDQSIYIWGDSHALHLVSGFSHAFPDYNVHVLYLSGCTPQSGFGGYVQKLPSPAQTKECVERNHSALNLFRRSARTNIILSGAQRSTPDSIATASREMMRTLRENGHNVMLFADFVRPGTHLLNCVNVPDFVISDAWIAKRCKGDDRRIEYALRYNDALTRLIPSVISPNEVQCPGGDCLFLYEQQLLFRDHHHLSMTGSIFFIERIKGQLPLAPGVTRSAQASRHPDPTNL